ncbi:hypothetical protein Tco_1438169 [Tanacetum coccineum]
MSKVEEAQGSALERKVTHPRIGAFEPKEDPEKEGIGMEEEHLWKTSLPPPPEREISPNKEDERKYGLVEAPVENKPPEKYPNWFSNPVLVKKANGSWRMCIDFKDLNKACPKDMYPLLEIDWKIESLMRFKFKCFLDAYKGYQQIQMSKKDEEKTAFHTNEGSEKDEAGPAQRILRNFDPQEGSVPDQMKFHGIKAMEELVNQAHRDLLNPLS